jgi:NAD(P)H-dependent FMN reductase
MPSADGLTVVIVSSSLANQSRSLLAAEYAGECLLGYGVKVELIDLRYHTPLPYPQSENDPETIALVQQFSAADAWVLASPVYNWGASGVLTNFLHYALDDVLEHRFRPFVVLGGVGGHKSHMSLDGLARTLVYEMWAVQVGPTVMATGPQADRERGLLDPELQQRIKRSIDALVHFAVASAALRSGASLPFAG